MPQIILQFCKVYLRFTLFTLFWLHSIISLSKDTKATFFCEKRSRRALLNYLAANTPIIKGDIVRKFISLALATVAACIVCVGSACAQSATSGLAFELSESGDGYVVVGMGSATATEIVIPSSYKSLPVTEIEDYAFKGNADITSVIIPDSVVNVGALAFNGCTSLEKVSLGDGVKEICKYAFAKCTSLDSAELGEGLKVIGEYAFMGCSALQDITLPEGVESVSDCAFRQSGLREVTLPDSLTSIGRETFSGCTDLAAISLGGGLREIDGWAFYMCSSLEEVVIPDSVTVISQNAFAYCTSLEKVTIGTGVSKIVDGAFLECEALKDVVFKTTTGWSHANISISSEGLSDSSAAAECVLQYYNQIWLRG